MPRNQHITAFFQRGHKRSRVDEEFETSDSSSKESVPNKIMHIDDGCDTTHSSATTQSVSVSQFSDISEHLKEPPSESTICKLIDSRIPHKNFTFPTRSYPDKTRKDGVRRRSCQSTWLAKYDFLSYSTKEDGLYCLSCVLFPTVPKNGSRAKLLITHPYRNWKDALNDLNTHAESLDYHKQSAARMKGFLDARKHPETRVDTRLSQDAAAQLQKNQLILKSIITCIELCGRQGLALRGHHVDSAEALLGSKSSINAGNFNAFLNFKVDSGDTILKEHLESCNKNARYTSSTCQNDLLLCIKDYIQNEIVTDINQQDFGPMFGIQADEVTDSSNWEQLGIVLRYMKDDKPVEKLIEFVECEETTGEAICDAIVSSLAKLKLLPENCRAQTYDGAGNMCGKQKGCASRFQQLSPRALYIHCSSHQLNLALSKACSLPEIHCMLSTIKSVGLFFKYSPKRSRELESSITSLNEGRPNKIKVSKVKLLCETRWVERHTSLEEFDEIYEALLICLEDISSKKLHSSWDKKTVIEASGLLTNIAKPAFIAAFQCALFFFGFTKSLSILIQGSSMDIVTAYEKIKLVKNEYSEIRMNADREFEKLFQLMLQMASLSNENGQPMGIPRRCGRQVHRSNIQADTPEQYWRRVVFVPYLDSLIEELDSRFSQLSIQAIRGLCLIPVNLEQLDDQRFNDLKSYYEADMPSAKTFDQEVRLWKREWENRHNKPSSVVATLDEINANLFPNIATIFRLLLLQPATSASVERANSALKRIKTNLRSTMGEDRLNALLLLHVHRDIDLDYDKIINMYATRHTRRMMLINPLAEDCGSNHS